MTSLRPYQLDIVERVLASPHRRTAIVLPTGAGKTRTAAAVVSALGVPTVFLCDRQELVDQALAAFGPAAGCMIGSAHRPGNPMVVGVYTAVRRQPVPAELVVVDECHLSAARTWRAVVDHYSAARIIGLTATLYRYGGGSLSDLFDDVVAGPPVSDLIAHGYLAPVRVFARREDVTRDVRMRGREFSAEDLDRVMRSSVLRASVAEWHRLADGRRTIAFAVSKAHAYALADELGMGWEVICEDTPREQRRTARERLTAGAIRGLVTVDALGIGFDCPAAEVALMCRPTMSRGCYRQQAGRVMRPSPATGKAGALLLDCAGNVARHGLPTSPDIVDLDGKVVPIPKRGAIVGLHNCPRCLCVYETGSDCPECHAPVPKPKRVVRHVAGTLDEVIGIEATFSQDWAARAGPEAKAAWARKRVAMGWPRKRIAAVWYGMFRSWPTSADWERIYRAA